MNVNLIKLKGVIRELHGIRVALERLGDHWERELNEQGLMPAKPDTSGPEPTIEYTDEGMDWLREEYAQFRRMEEREHPEDMEP